MRSTESAEIFKYVQLAKHKIKTSHEHTRIALRIC